MKKQNPFNAQKFETSVTTVLIPYNRRDYYKIWLTVGDSKIHYADKSIDISQPALILSNPLVPYSFESNTEGRWGYMCIFTEEFMKENDRIKSIQQSTLFKPGSDKVFFLNDEQLKSVCNIYENILQELSSDYTYKYDAIRNYINLLIHETMKLQPTISASTHPNASTRIASLFIELLERQFPIDSPDRELKLRKANDYAESLSVHVNHLNHAVKEITGKSTSVHISERIINEAKALLKHTDWNIATIAYSLGFEYPTYFNNFFKKNTGVTPLSLRR
ncbi:MAG: AraC family transcriptional regulator [Bacteroidetes bacterium 43-93]|nr:MAG: AraC family transcriptional regulator [Bacteroidetes bacterium 43-93]